MQLEVSLQFPLRAFMIFVVGGCGWWKWLVDVAGECGWWMWLVYVFGT